MFDPRPLPTGSLPDDLDQRLADGRVFGCTAVTVRRPRSFGAIAGCRLIVAEDAVALRFVGRTYAFVVAGEGIVETSRSRIWGLRVRLMSDLVDATVTPNDEEDALAALRTWGWVSAA